MKHIVKALTASVLALAIAAIAFQQGRASASNEFQGNRTIARLGGDGADPKAPASRGGDGTGPRGESPANQWNGGDGTGPKGEGGDGTGPKGRGGDGTGPKATGGDGTGPKLST